MDGSGLTQHQGLRLIPLPLSVVLFRLKKVFPPKSYSASEMGFLVLDAINTIKKDGLAYSIFSRKPFE